MFIVFRHISNLPQSRGWEKKIAEGPPCVVLATPGMLQTGPSRELLDLWAPDPRNGLVVTGYSVDGTMARVSNGYLEWALGCTYSLLYSYEDAIHFFHICLSSSISNTAFPGVSCSFAHRYSVGYPQ